MTPSAVGCAVAAPPRAAGPVRPSVRAARDGRLSRRRRAQLAARDRQSPPLTYDVEVNSPVLLKHEADGDGETFLVDEGAKATDLDGSGNIPARIRPAQGEGSGAADVGADAPASADDPAAPGSSITLFEQAVEQNSRRLLAIARAIVGYRASPEDVVQQAVMNLYKHRARYDWRKPGGLLKRATVNEALRLLRPPRMTMVADDHPAALRAPSTEMETNETVRKVREAIDQLPDHFRAALVLCEYEGMSYAQIAETLEASIPQIKTWLHRARRKLATILEPYMNEQQQAQQAAH